MKCMRTWSIRRQTIRRSDAQTRWDQAYQHLLQWTTPNREGAQAAPLAPQQEAPDAHGPLCPRLDQPTSPSARSLEQPLERLRAHVQARGETVAERDVFRDAGSSGASLSRPGLDQLRDRAALAEFDRVVVTAADRLARKYVHHVLLMEEFQSSGCTVEFLERPMSQDPHDQLLLQIRGAVAEYERTLICPPDASRSPDPRFCEWSRCADGW